MNSSSQDESEIRTVGARLEQDSSGGIIETDQNSAVLFYTKLPSSPTLAYIKEGFIVPYAPKLIRQLCELSEQAAGIESSWAAQSKAVGRVIVRCSYAADIRVRHQFCEKRGHLVR